MLTLPMFPSDPESPWLPISKANDTARSMADRHYTRQTVGHPMWTRPDYNFCLLSPSKQGSALFAWWRPKWEDENPHTDRKDGLRAIECTVFRREGRHPWLASDLIQAAVAALAWPEAASALRLDNAGPIPWLITGVGSQQTADRRSSRSLPGACFRYAGWEEFEKPAGKADVWLRLPWRNPADEALRVLEGRA